MILSSASTEGRGDVRMSNTLVQRSTGQTTKTFNVDIHCPQRMRVYDFVNPLVKISTCTQEILKSIGHMACTVLPN